MTALVTERVDVRTLTESPGMESRGHCGLAWLREQPIRWWAVGKRLEYVLRSSPESQLVWVYDQPEGHPEIARFLRKASDHVEEVDSKEKAIERLEGQA